jgi:hypothetical protein
MKARFDSRPTGPRAIADHFTTLLAVFCLVLTGCHTHKLSVNQAKYKPTNVYYKSKVLDPKLKRVAVLPLSTSLSSESLQAGIEILQPLVHAELDKTKRFELMIISQQQMIQWTGKASWRSDDQLPADFFDKLHEMTDCDAVFFTELTRYSAYPPLAIGWKLALVQTIPHEILWAVDEIFDAGDETVANAARHYSSEHIHVEAPLSDPESILGSPSRFGQYSLHELLVLLPLR